MPSIGAALEVKDGLVFVHLNVVHIGFEVIMKHVHRELDGIASFEQTGPARQHHTDTAESSMGDVADEIPARAMIGDFSKNRSLEDHHFRDGVSRQQGAEIFNGDRHGPS